MNSFFAASLTIGIFLGLANVALREMPQPQPQTGYSASDRAGMDSLIRRVTTPKVNKLPPFSMPSKKDARFVSLARLAAAGGYGSGLKPSRDGFTEALTAFELGSVR